MRPYTTRLDVEGQKMPVPVPEPVRKRQSHLRLSAINGLRRERRTEKSFLMAGRVACGRDR